MHRPPWQTGILVTPDDETRRRGHEVKRRDGGGHAGAVGEPRDAVKRHAAEVPEPGEGRDAVQIREPAEELLCYRYACFFGLGK